MIMIDAVVKIKVKLCNYNSLHPKIVTNIKNIQFHILEKDHPRGFISEIKKSRSLFYNESVIKNHF